MLVKYYLVESQKLILKICNFVLKKMSEISFLMHLHYLVIFKKSSPPFFSSEIFPCKEDKARHYPGQIISRDYLGQKKTKSFLQESKLNTLMDSAFA